MNLLPLGAANFISANSVFSSEAGGSGCGGIASKLAPTFGVTCLACLVDRLLRRAIETCVRARPF